MEIGTSFPSYKTTGYGSTTRTETCTCGSCPLCRKATAATQGKPEKKAADAPNELSAEEKKQVEKLKRTDREVRAHEQAHSAAGGQYTRGGASYEYASGPDGKKYAVGGEVSIDTSPVSGDPQATIRKMMIVRKAALAPASPSGQDRAVAAAATQEMNNARQELNQMRTQASNNHETGAPQKSGTTESPKTRGYSHQGTVQDSHDPQSPLLDLLA